MFPPRRLALLLFAAFSAISGGQTPPPSGRTIVSRVAPRAIERGISPDLSHAPGTPEARRRRSIQGVRPQLVPNDRFYVQQWNGYDGTLAGGV